MFNEDYRLKDSPINKARGSKMPQNFSEVETEVTEWGIQHLVNILTEK